MTAQRASNPGRRRLHHAKSLLLPPLLGLLGLAATPARAQTASVVLDFEGVANSAIIGEFYNGGTDSQGNPGTDFGISFVNAVGLIDADAGGGGNFANEPSPDTVMFFSAGSSAVMNVAGGFDTGFSFFYTTVAAAGMVVVYDGLDATGNILAQLDLPALGSDCAGDPNGTFCNWGPIGIAFAGIARSVDFGGVAAQVAFDNITLGAESPSSCPTEQNPFAATSVEPVGGGAPGPAIFVYTGPEDAWAGCASAGQILAFGANTIPLFATAGHQQTDPGVDGVGPCQRLDDPNDPDGAPILATGDEICALDFRIEIRGGPGWFTSFVPDPASFDADISGRSIITFPAASAIDSSTREIRVVILSSTAPFAAGPGLSDAFHRIASVGVFVEPETSAPNRGIVEVVTKSGVGFDLAELDRAAGVGGVKADLSGIPLVNNVVGLPEPGVWLQLPAALAGLGLLARLRGRRGRSRAAGRSG